MTDQEITPAQTALSAGPYEVDLQSLWEKYEDIAMHFNTLLMKLRTQALAGIAAISALIGIFTKAEATVVQADWLIAAGLFAGLALFWIAICCLDLLYYNRLLVGSVTALKLLEAEIKKREFTSISMSTEIIKEFGNGWLPTDKASFAGIYIFYVIVFVVLVMAATFSWYMHCAVSI